MTEKRVEEGIILKADFEHSKYTNDFSIVLEIKGYDTWGFASMRFTGIEKIKEFYDEFFYESDYNKKLSDLVNKEIVMLPSCWTCVSPAIARFSPYMFPEHKWVYNSNHDKEEKEGDKNG